MNIFRFLFANSIYIWKLGSVCDTQILLLTYLIWNLLILHTLLFPLQI